MYAASFRRWLAGICMVLTLNGCGHYVSSLDLQITDYQPLPAPKPEHGLVVFLWPQSQFNNIAIAVYDGEKVIGGLLANGYCYVNVTPGKHHFWVRTSSDNPSEHVLITVSAGEVYFVQYYMRLAMYVNIRQLSPISRDVALPQLPALALTQPNTELTVYGNLGISFQGEHPYLKAREKPFVPGGNHDE